MNYSDQEEESDIQAQLEAKDQFVLPFTVSTLNVSGKLAFLGSVVNPILKQHNYPLPVSKLVAEGIILTTLLGVSLKTNGQIIMQIQTDGPVSLIVVNYRVPGKVRAYAKFDANAIEKIVNTKADNSRQSAELLGKGHLAFTIDHGEHAKRYQGLVALEGMTIEEAALEYFEKSEQIPTCIKLSVGEINLPSKDKGLGRHWTAGGVLVQSLPDSNDQIQLEDIDSKKVIAENNVMDNLKEDAWIEAQALVKTISDAELSLPDVSAVQLLVRLFHHHELRVFPVHNVEQACQCNQQSIKMMLANFEEKERIEMIEEGKIIVVCEFCNARYEFELHEFAK